MKSKLVIASLLLLAGATTLTAQEKTKYYSESWTDNIFVSVGGGIQATSNPDSKFTHTITPVVNLSLGKYITPVWGVRAQAYGWQTRLKTDYPAYDDREKNYREMYVGGNVDGLLNLTNLFLGYEPGRVAELYAFLGPSVNVTRNYKHAGWVIPYKEVITATEYRQEPDYQSAYLPASAHKLRWLVGASVGLGAKFNVNDYLAVDLEARGQVTPSIMGAYSTGYTEGYVYLTAGLTYTFGGKKFAPVKKTAPCDNSALNDEINRLRNALNAANNRAPETKIVEKQVFVKDTAFLGPRTVFFKLASSEIDQYGKVNIKLAAKVIKENPGKIYRIAGYADKATGSSSFNQKLTERRAQAVYDALVAEGVDKNQLKIVAFGGVENMFGSNELNRVVIME